MERTVACLPGEYGPNLAKVGYTFDGWRQLDYWFDLVVELGKKGKRRTGRVAKTRIETFPDEEVFDWSYGEIRRRYDVTMLERAAATITPATPQQVKEMKELLGFVRLPEGLVGKWFRAAQVEDWEDMPSETIAKCIGYVKERLEISPTSKPSMAMAAAKRRIVPIDAPDRDLAPLAARF